MEQNEMKGLYPEIEPYQTGHLKVSPIHEIYYEQCGNPQGKPVLFVHGGPGGGTGSKERQFFDPNHYRIILFHQRGCGQSRPHACLEENTTWHLVADMELLRESLNIEQWMVFGGSWGSTLSLSYAQTHPTRVTELVLRGIFMLRRKEIRWFYQEGASFIYPDAWESYLSPIPEEERGDLLSAYYKRLTHEDVAVRQEAAKAWSIWEGSTSFLYQSPENIAKCAGDDFSMAFARIECHYFTHHGFFEREEQLLEDIDKIRHIPTVIVQGRYDVVCPMQSAWELHRVWPEADLKVVQGAGHSSLDPGNLHELVSATDAFRT